MDNNGPKRNMLLQLIQAAMSGSAGKNLNDIIAGIKNALATSDKFAKAWDSANGIVQQKPQSQQGQPQQAPQQRPPMA